ncbi:hypothetical protein QBC46DRAFT_386420 [Diplogelasinospora grovesii]|uniref:NmrA-like domain-containing protein n=1 Tax=Diplogelasinospora grovesii TaxID=303347 RepID=A0AAN6NA21_9PEZI|nr:hypothetical protein QBC46DRAFT_386420 [Diplogelasinospora grovesii]
MVSIKTVAVLGGTGNLGTHIVQELLSAGFAVTALTREGSSSTDKLPAGVEVKTVDYTSFDSLRAAFSGQDAVVSVVGTTAVGNQKIAVDAAIAAGVKRFIPSEFGINTREVRDRPIGKILAVKIGIVDYLQEKAKENPSFTWTGLTTGSFFDWGLQLGILGINPKDQTANIVDSGNEKWQASNLPQIGKGIVGILQHPDETANKYLATASFNVSQNEIIAIVEELSGSKLTVTSQSSAELRKIGEEKLAKGDYSAFLDLLRVHNYADGAGNALSEEKSANKLIELPYEDVRSTVQSWLSKAGAI